MTHDKFYSVTSVPHHLMFDPPAAPETSILTVFPTAKFFLAREYFFVFPTTDLFFASEYFLILGFQGLKLRMDQISLLDLYLNSKSQL